MHKSNLIRNWVEPLFARIGTATASALVAYGVAEHDATVIASAVVVVAGLGFDFGMRKWQGR